MITFLLRAAEVHEIRSFRHKKFGKFLLIVVSTTITCLIVEIGFRIVAYRRDMNSIENLEPLSGRPKAGEKVQLKSIIRLSSNPRIIYSLIPDLSVMFVNQLTKINENGFRGEVIPIEKKSDAVRIVGLGDSVMFGWGVREEETYLAVLSRTLNSKYPECSWEVINMAVPGYNTAMEVESLKVTGLLYRPDIVIINYIGNDLDLPNFIRKQENYFARDQSFLFKYFDKKLYPARLSAAPLKSDGKAFESEPRKVPPQYQGLVGFEAYKAAMKELQVMSQENEFEVVVLAEQTLPDTVKKISAGLGFRLVEPASLWKIHASESGLNLEDDWMLSKSDPHPSVTGHRIMAASLFNSLESDPSLCRETR